MKYVHACFVITGFFAMCWSLMYFSYQLGKKRTYDMVNARIEKCHKLVTNNGIK